MKKNAYKVINKYFNTNYRFNHDIDWLEISKSNKLTPTLMMYFRNHLNWNIISSRQSLSEDSIRKFKFYVNWNYISKFQTLSEEFIRKHKDFVDWVNICIYQVLSEEFIEKEINTLTNYSTFISKYQTLSENFMEKYKDRVVWDSISIGQILSWEFIKRNLDKLYIPGILKYQPFIENPEVFEKQDMYISPRNNLYTQYMKTKDQGWFVDYIVGIGSDHNHKKELIELKNINSLTKITYKHSVSKVRIYWEDLHNRFNLDKYDIIRKIKSVV